VATSDFTPISSHSWAAARSWAIPRQRAGAAKVATAGPVHHAGQQPDLKLRCVSSRAPRPRRPRWSICPTAIARNAIGDLSKHGAKGAFQTGISRFAADTHPTFRSIKTDPGKLKFNHQRHLAAGMALGKDGRRDPDTRENARAAPQNAIAINRPGRKTTPRSQLQCASCHQLDAGRSRPGCRLPLALQDQRPTGAYMLPDHLREPVPGVPSLVTRPGDSPASLAAQGTARCFLENSSPLSSLRGQAGFLEKKLVRPLPGKFADLADADTA